MPHADLSRSDREFLERVSNGIERGVKTVLENPLLLIGLMALSLFLKRFAAPTARDPADSSTSCKDQEEENSLNDPLDRVVSGTRIVLSRPELASGLLLAALIVVAFSSSEEL